jgi:hypothetical protein
MELLQNLHSKKMPVFLTWLFFFFFLMVLGSELRDSFVQGRCSTTLAMPPVLFALVILEIGSHFLHKPTWTSIFPFDISHIAGWQAQAVMLSFFALRWVSWTFDLGWHGTVVPPISASHVAWDDRHMLLHPDIGSDGVWWTFCSGWLWTTILPTSDS